MAESLCCPPETVTALLIDSTPIQNKKFKKKSHRNLRENMAWIGSSLCSDLTDLPGFPRPDPLIQTFGKSRQLKVSPSQLVPFPFASKEKR